MADYLRLLDECSAVKWKRQSLFSLPPSEDKNGNT